MKTDYFNFLASIAKINNTIPLPEGNGIMYRDYLLFSGNDKSIWYLTPDIFIEWKKDLPFENDRIYKIKNTNKFKWDNLKSLERFDTCHLDVRRFPDYNKVIKSKVVFERVYRKEFILKYHLYDRSFFTQKTKGNGKDYCKINDASVVFSKKHVSMFLRKGDMLNVVEVLLTDKIKVVRLIASRGDEKYSLFIPAETNEVILEEYE